MKIKKLKDRNVDGEKSWNIFIEMIKEKRTHLFKITMIYNLNFSMTNNFRKLITTKIL
jgi:hypothetical protein